MAITGVGCVTPLGTGAQALLEGWSSGACAIEGGFGRCRDFDPRGSLSRAEIRRTDRHVQMALVASDEAVTQAGWDGGLPYDPSRIGCVIATTTAGQETIEREFNSLREYGAKGIAPLRILLALPNAAAVCIAMRVGIQGECFGLLGACAGGAQAIGAGMRLVRSGAVDAVIVGGADAGIGGLVTATYSSLGALSPTGTCRPFDRRRDGMIQSEGAGVLVLENAACAAARGAPVLGESIGFGATNDAHHFTVPHQPGQVRAMEMALGDAGVTPDAVDYVNAHGTGTKLNDATETRALKTVLDGHAHQVPVSSLKSSIGHLLGAAGAVEVIGTLLMLREGVVAPTLGLDDPDDDLDLDYVPRRRRPLDVSDTATAMSNSFGLGGHNGCVLVRAPAGSLS